MKSLRSWGGILAFTVFFLGGGCSRKNPSESLTALSPPILVPTPGVKNPIPLRTPLMGEGGTPIGDCLADSRPNFLPPNELAGQHWNSKEDVQDCLQNLAHAPEDLENGVGWAWDILRALPVNERPIFLDQVLPLLPLWAWPRVDPILPDVSCGEEVQAVLFRRLLETPLPTQAPRLVRIAANPNHPSKPKADALLQSYFPEIPPGDYPAYQARVDGH